MNVARYADYIGDLRALFAELDRRSERFQTFDMRLELIAAGSLVVYETKRRKGQTDSLYYGRSAATGQNQQISQAAAFSAIDRFFSLGQFVALSDQATAGGAIQSTSMNAQYPHCAVNFSYRKKGQAVARSMLMVFIGFNDETDALEFISLTDEPAFVMQRPHHTAKSYEWK